MAVINAICEVSIHIRLEEKYAVGCGMFFISLDVTSAFIEEYKIQ